MADHRLSSWDECVDVPHPHPARLPAHPDDEASSPGARGARRAEGHRVILVVATDGGPGLAAQEFAADGGLPRPTHVAELHHEPAAALGVARVATSAMPTAGSVPTWHPDPPGATTLRARRRGGGGQVAFRHGPGRGAGRRAASARAQRWLRPPRPRRFTSRPPRRRARAHRGCWRRRSPGTPSPGPSTSRRRSIASHRSSTGRVSTEPSRREQRDHPPDQRARHIAAKRAAMRAHASQARVLTAGPTARWRPSWHPPPALRPRLRPRVVHRPCGGPVDPIRRDVFESWPEGGGRSHPARP